MGALYLENFKITLQVTDQTSVISVKIFLYFKNGLVWFNIEVLKACLKACQNEP